jgi:FkbM family methyltransferase
VDRVAVFRRIERAVAKVGVRRSQFLVRSSDLFWRILVGEEIVVRVGDFSIAGPISNRGLLLMMQGAKYEPLMTRLFGETIEAGMVVCDIGAHIGYFSLFAAARVGPRGKVFSFEPDPRSFRYLTKNILLNNLCGVVEPVQKAVSDTSSPQRSLYLHPHDTSLSSFFHQKASSVRTTVESVSLDDFFLLSGFRHGKVDVVKIDVEGGEMLVLDGMKRTLDRSTRLTMFVECNPKALRAARSSPRELLNRLYSMGFVVEEIREEDGTLRPAMPETTRCVNLKPARFA